MKTLRSWLVRGALPAVLLAPISCGETTYDLYSEVSQDNVATGGTMSTGGTDWTGNGSGGLLPNGGATFVGDLIECEAARDASLDLVRVRSTTSQLCLSQGAPTLLADDPGFEVSLESCLQDPSQYWTISGVSPGAWEFRHEGAAMNLDVRFADTTDGTPLVLYEPHQLYNQQFFIFPGPGDSFSLAPRNAQNKCVDVRDGAVEIWPCDPANPNQLFEEISCRDDAP